MTLKLLFWNGKKKFIPAQPIIVGDWFSDRIDVHDKYPKHNIVSVIVGNNEVKVYLDRKKA